MKKGYQIGGLLKKNSRCKESNRLKQKKEGERSSVAAISKHRRVTANRHQNSLSTGHHRWTSLSPASKSFLTWSLPHSNTWGCDGEG
ncbi:hypothetical protein QL285_015485 [Trifolium repens]|nr:hypothetical protein QL285_015485 [Trifolium repens]